MEKSSWKFCIFFMPIKTDLGFNLLLVSITLLLMTIPRLWACCFKNSLLTNSWEYTLLEPRVLCQFLYITRLNYKLGDSDLTQDFALNKYNIQIQIYKYNAFKAQGRFHNFGFDNSHDFFMPWQTLCEPFSRLVKYWTDHS